MVFVFYFAFLDKLSLNLNITCFWNRSVAVTGLHLHEWMIPVFCVCVCVCVRDELFRQSLSRLREQVVKANTLVREANFLAEEMSKLTDYQVTLQIPAANLSANRKVRPLNHTPPRHQLTRGYCIPSCKVWNMGKISKSVILFFYSAWSNS